MLKCLSGLILVLLQQCRHSDAWSMWFSLDKKIPSYQVDQTLRVGFNFQRVPGHGCRIPWTSRLYVISLTFFISYLEFETCLRGIHLALHNFKVGLVKHCRYWRAIKVGLVKHCRYWRAIITYPLSTRRCFYVATTLLMLLQHQNDVVGLLDCTYRESIPFRVVFFKKYTERYLGACGIIWY